VIGFRFVADHRADYRVTDLCRVAGVSRSGYYAWRRRPLSAHRRADTLLLEEIRTIHQDSLGTYGRPRIWGQLRRQGLEVGQRRVGRLMRQNHLVGAYGRRRGRPRRTDQGTAPDPDLLQRSRRWWRSAPHPPGPGSTGSAAGPAIRRSRLGRLPDGGT
jgi:hypothetical protein